LRSGVLHDSYGARRQADAACARGSRGAALALRAGQRASTGPADW